MKTRKWSNYGFSRTIIIIADENQNKIADVRYQSNEQEMIENARLIIAAPDLLESLEEMIEGVDICTPDAPEPLPNSIIGKARAAVRKAKGEL